ncbi:hypothetical protein ABB37_03889 [Leptomonas pyrrhocoris]|uniref:200 kDa antigen p200 n=1 Tax=Leptomonas pyrrhocoris TaxID=157538 RepID=A0A0M9G3E0_LEPPY|nr:hypothetical protein ABB37_03889 [Leptomonas pyrrhocoris]KPA81545.1 hypothetical protein ABB37_03889 [Leptomonas pyrrhocoris]|eukprot:XP_015659984.1 hypothetical protein ABB37_03889 [Leptomonas pyrrhocoris]
MFSESDEDEQYTVHEVDGKEGVTPQPDVSLKPAEAPEAVMKADNAAAASPLARYYRLGTKQRHAFDEHMRRLREEAQRTQQEREFRQHYPFRPSRETAAYTTLEREVNVPPKKERGDEALVEQPRETVSISTTPAKPVFHRLAAQAVQLELRRRHREEQKRRAEAAALRDAFQPAINRQAPVYTDELCHLDDVPVEERLLHYGETIARERQRRQEMKVLEEQAVLQAAQAAGTGGSDSALQQMNPAERRRLREEFEERNTRFLAQKAQHRVRAEKEATGTFSFQPQISATSAALDDARQREVVQARKAELEELLDRTADGAPFTVIQHSTSGSRDVSRRSDALYAHAVARQRKLSQPLRQHEKINSARDKRGVLDGSGKQTSTSSAFAHEEEPPYQPRTNPTSSKWIASGPHRHFFEQDFVCRQALYAQVREEEANLNAEVEPKMAASPNAARGTTNSDAGDRLVAAAATTKAYKANTKVLNERLYYSAKKASEVARRRREASLNAQECPFRPELSPGTQYVLKRMKPLRDGDVVKRLTGAVPPLAQKRAEIDDEKKDLYEPTPNTRRSDSLNTRSASPSASQGLSTDGARAEPPQQPPRKRSMVTRDQIEHFYQRQLDFLQERRDLIQERREGEVVQELVECTFRPRTNVDRHDGAAASPRTTGCAEKSEERGPSVNQVTGVTGFLERQKTARQRKAAQEELVRTMGLPRHKSAANLNFVTGTTVLSPFTLQTAQRQQQRRRSSCSPSTQRTLSPANGVECGENARTWVNELTSSERVLYDALEESEHYPASSTAPLHPLPGYIRSEEEGDDDTVYLDDVEGYAYTAANDRGDADSAEAAYMPRPSLPLMLPTCRDVGAEAHREKTSLFSSLSPNTFSGRSLAARAANRHQADGSAAARSHSSEKPSALKGTVAAQLTSSAQRRKQRRTVSFAVDGSASSPLGGRKALAVSSHADPTRRLSH